MTEKENTPDESIKGLVITIVILLIGAIAAGCWFYNIIENKTKYQPPINKEKLK